MELECNVVLMAFTSFLGNNCVIQKNFGLAEPTLYSFKISLSLQLGVAHLKALVILFIVYVIGSLVLNFFNFSL